jgi:NAD(P)-dependent dehydrogenase (short-subunit alcohol dehydrogenase family)
METAEKTFLVTGSASGLGEATARALVDAGARVVVADLDQERGSKVVADLGEQARFAPSDVAQEDSPMLNGEIVRLDGALRMAPR